MNVALYSALYGRYDTVKAVPADLGCPAFLFTDSDEIAEEGAAKGWLALVVRHGIATVRADVGITAPMLAHKWWKTHPDIAVPGVETSIWVDASMEIKVPDFVGACLGALDDDEWSLPKHPVRGCIYDEAEYSATLTWRYDPAEILAQAEFYRQFHPPGWGLFATGHLVRRHTPQVISTSHLWWEECVTWSHQDQVSLPVLLRLKEIRFNTRVPWHEWWTLHAHGA